MDRDYILHFCCGIIFGMILFAGMNYFLGGKEVDVIIGEAEGEPYMGKLAVACAIRNRGTLVGVYGQNARRVKDKLYSRQVLIDSTLAWEESKYPAKCEFISGAQHWQSQEDLAKHPSWVTNCDQKTIIGGHTFFKCS